MCLVRSWNFGFLANFIADVLSIMSGVDCICFTCKSSRIFLSHTISFVASAAATYSASVVESAGTDCLCDLQETTHDPRLIAYPEVDTPIYLSPSMSKSQYPIKLKSSTCVYLIPEVLSTRRGVEFTCFSCKSSSIFLSHTISFVASAAATYSASVVESAGTDCLRDLLETIVDQRLMR